MGRPETSAQNHSIGISERNIDCLDDTIDGGVRELGVHGQGQQLLGQALGVGQAALGVAQEVVAAHAVDRVRVVDAGGDALCGKGCVQLPCQRALAAGLAAKQRNTEHGDRVRALSARSARKLRSA